MTPYGDIDLGPHWLKQCLVMWRHLAIHETNADLFSNVFGVIRLRSITPEVLMNSIRNMHWEIALLKSPPYLPGNNEFDAAYTSTMWDINIISMG